MSTKEPTHLDGEGRERPGALDLKSSVTKEYVAKSDELWDEHEKNTHNRKRLSGQFPSISDPYSQLETLITDAIMRYGNMGTDTITGDIKMMMLRYANIIVEDMRSHPYATMPDIDYYISLTDFRPIPDEIMISGLLYHYSKWMKDDTMRINYAEYQKVMGQILYQRKYGSGKIEMGVVDR